MKPLNISTPASIEKTSQRIFNKAIKKSASIEGALDKRRKANSNWADKADANIEQVHATIQKTKR